MQTPFQSSVHMQLPHIFVVRSDHTNTVYEQIHLLGEYAPDWGNCSSESETNPTRPRGACLCNSSSPHEGIRFFVLALT
jgi:hypothetical protein